MTSTSCVSAKLYAKKEIPRKGIAVVVVMEPTRSKQWELKARKNEKFAGLLREIRKEAGMGQKELARKLKRPQPYVSKLENGRAFITLVEFEEYSFAIGVNPVKALSRLYT